MIHVESLSPVNDRLTMAQHLVAAPSLKAKMKVAIEVVKHLEIDGLITGSCWLPDFDPDIWGSTPDVDVFVYSEKDLIKAVMLAEHRLAMTPGTGTERSEKQERWKLDRLFEHGLNRKIGVTTYKFHCNGIVLNLTFKQMRDNEGRWTPCNNALSVLRSFDMSIVMQGYDIKSRVFFDMRPDNVPPKVAVPNPLRKQDCAMWTVAKWVRQFDRVVKYYARGFDTRPMAEFYLRMIDECIEAGSLFDSEESNEAFMSYSKEFLEKRNVIADWLESKKGE